MSDELDDLLNELKNAKGVPAVPTPKPKGDEVTESTINEYILKKASELIDAGMFTVEGLKNDLASAYEANEIESYAALIRSVNDTIDTLNKINIQNKKAKTSKEIKQMDIDARLQLGPQQHNTNVLIATREEIMKNLVESLSKDGLTSNKIIDVTPDKEDS